MRGESEVPGGALNLISTNYPDHGHHGRLPLSRKNAHGRAGNRTQDLMVSSQDLWPPSHEAGLLKNVIHSIPIFRNLTETFYRSQWPRGLRRRSTAARPLRLWVGIPPVAWKFVCCECCVSSGRGLCDGLITRPEESYRMWRVAVCD